MKTTFSMAWRVSAGGGTSRFGTLLAVLPEEHRVEEPREPGADLSVFTRPYTVFAGLEAVSGLVIMDDWPVYASAMVRGWLADSYYQIWVIPAVLVAQNPRVNVPIPFNIWNAYPFTNEVVSIVGTDDTGLQLSFEPGDAWRGIEFREVNITILPSAPIQVEASYLFNFEAGVGRFRFEAVIADFVQMRPDPPVTEVWDWLTDVIVAYDGSEQRIALRKSPRRSTSYEIGLEDGQDRRQQYNRWFKSLATRLVFPYYQYSSRVTQTSLIGDVNVYFDTTITDVRAGGYIVVLNEEAETGALVKIDAVFDTYIVSDSPLQFNVTRGSIAAPAYSSRIANNTGFDWFQVHGTLKVEAQVLDIQDSFSRPGSTAVIETLNDLPILTERPIATGGPSSDRFDVNYEIIDSQTGLLDIKSSWPHPYIDMTRRFAVRRHAEPAKMDYWRDFLDIVRGKWRPFYFPTWLADLVVIETPDPSSNSLRVYSADYVAAYFPHETYKQIQIELRDGRLLHRTVLTAVSDVPGEATLSLSVAFGDDPADRDILTVSYLNLVRLGSDRVSLMHGHLRTEIELNIRTTDSRDGV